MVKKGFVPEWKPVHTTAVEDYENQHGDQGKLSPKFSDFGNVMKWLDEDT